MTYSLSGYPFMASAPVVDCSGTIASNTAVTPGQSIQITNGGTVANSVTLTLPTGNSLIVTPQVGDNIYPYAVTKAVWSGGTLTLNNLFVSS